MQEEIVRDVSMAEIADMLGINTSVPGIVDIDDTGLEIMTPTGFKPVSSYVVKERAEGWQLGKLLATSVHRVFDDKSLAWRYVSEMPDVIRTGKEIDVVDLEVPDGECYVANGWVNHNTTPGGWN
jgi:hypothetical protein